MKADSRQLRRLAISGKMASGKDAVAVAALDLLELPYRRINLADAMRSELAECLVAAREGDRQLDMALRRWDPEGRWPEQSQQLRAACLTVQSADERTSAARIALQQMAWLARRQRRDFWTSRHAAAVEAASSENPETAIVTTDVREPDEILHLARRGFVIVRLTVTPETQRQRLSARDGITADHTLSHSNETALDRPDPKVAQHISATVSNDGPIEDTAQAIARLLRRRWRPGGVRR